MEKILGRNRADIDLLVNSGGQYSPLGGASSGIAEKLLKNNMDPACLRPWEENGRFYVNGAGGKPVLTNNALLRKEEWVAVDTAVTAVARRRLNGVADLYQRNLIYRLRNGLGSTVLETTVMSDTSDAQISMDAATRAKNDRHDFSPGYLPLPIIHKDWSLDIRTLAASRNKGQALDTIQAESASRKVAEMAEYLLFCGYNSFTFGGGVLYGYTDHPSRNLYTLTGSWTDSGYTGEDILRDVLGMIQSALDDRHYGPFLLYVPPAYQTVLSEDFKSNSDKSIRQRLLEIQGLEDIKVSEFLENDNVTLVEMTSDTIREVEGLPIQTIQWSEEGGLILKFKVMAIMVPQIRADYDGRSGLVHGSV